MRRALDESTVTESPYGSFAVLHAGLELAAWAIRKDGEEVDPSWTTFSRDDFLFVLEGTLKLDFPEGDPVVLREGEAWVIPAGRPFRGYRYPRDGAPCVFLAVSSAGVEESKTRVAG